MMDQRRKTGSFRLLAVFTETFGLSRPLAVGALALVSLVTVFAVFWFFHSAPPRTITITAGPKGSSFEGWAEKYRAILASNHVTMRVLESEGSLQNLQRLNDRRLTRVDIGFVQGGVTNATSGSKLVSLGSVSYEPLFVFYRAAAPIGLLSELNGKKLAIGPAGSGARSLALTLLATNGIVPGGATTLLDLDAAEAAKGLMEGSVDAVFMMGDSASPQLMVKLLHTPEIRLLDFPQADAYTRKISYLNKLQLPRGSLDFGKDIPPHDVNLLSPTVELIARPDLHPALSDLLLEAAREVHGGASLLKRRGEFPAPLEHDFPISPEAMSFYKSGKSFLYRRLPFWLASLVNRFLVAFVPAALVLIPALRMIPNAYKWRVRLLIYRWYRALLGLERELLDRLTPEKQKELVARLDHIETAVNRMRVPASFADQFYGLRGHIDFVRERLVGSAQPH
jgi:TRAP-type uncharacterized transport system substrate-binding protein